MKSPDAEDSRGFEENDESEVIRVANLLVDEVIEKAQEQAAIKVRQREVLQI